MYTERRKAAWLQVIVRERGLGLWCRLNAGPIRDAQRRLGGIRGLRRYRSTEPLQIKQ